MCSDHEGQVCLKQVVDATRREQMDLSTGAVRKGLLEQGQGSESPAEGDLVSVRTCMLEAQAPRLMARCLEAASTALVPCP